LLLGKREKFGALNLPEDVKWRRRNDSASTSSPNDKTYYVRGNERL